MLTKVAGRTSEESGPGIVLAIIIFALLVGTLWSFVFSRAESEATFYFNGAVEVTGISNGYGDCTSWLKYCRAVEIMLVRSSEYKVLPKDAYDVRITIPHSISRPQSAIFAAGEHDETHLINLKWQWPENTIAEQESRAPNIVKVTITREGDGRQESNYLDLPVIIY